MNKLFGIGLSKTGTTSLHDAFEKLGYKSITFPHDHQTIYQLETGVFELDILKKVDAITDVTIVPFFKQLDRSYPGSKFILTVRDRAGWLKSVEAHWSRFRVETRDNPRFFVRAAVYGSIEFHAGQYADVYDAHVREVQHYFRDRPDDLLVFNICGGEGWEKLCPFLGKAMPADSFPHSFKTAY